MCACVMPCLPHGEFACASGFLPGNTFIACCPITTCPEELVNTGIKLTDFSAPPASSQESQTLYEAPSPDSLKCVVNCSGVKAYLRVGTCVVCDWSVSS